MSGIPALDIPPFISNNPALNSDLHLADDNLTIVAVIGHGIMEQPGVILGIVNHLLARNIDISAMEKSSSKTALFKLILLTSTRHNS